MAGPLLVAQPVYAHRREEEATFHSLARGLASLLGNLRNGEIQRDECHAEERLEIGTVGVTTAQSFERVGSGGFKRTDFRLLWQCANFITLWAKRFSKTY